MSDTAATLAVLRRAPAIMAALDACERLALPNYYVAGGALTQTIWNHLAGRPLEQGIKDIDVIYFDALTPDAAQKERESALLANYQATLPLDVTNQAWVHRWYPSDSGDTLSAFIRVEEGIATWLPAFALGIRQDAKELTLHAPYGLSDLWQGIVRPNPLRMTATVYQAMCNRYQARWPEITLLPWTT